MTSILRSNFFLCKSNQVISDEKTIPSDKCLTSTVALVGLALIGIGVLLVKEVISLDIMPTLAAGLGYTYIGLGSTLFLYAMQKMVEHCRCTLKNQMPKTRPQVAATHASQFNSSSSGSQTLVLPSREPSFSRESIVANTSSISNNLATTPEVRQSPAKLLADSWAEERLALHDYETIQSKQEYEESVMHFYEERGIIQNPRMLITPVYEDLGLPLDEVGTFNWSIRGRAPIRRTMRQAAEDIVRVLNEKILKYRIEGPLESSHRKLGIELLEDRLFPYAKMRSEDVENNFMNRVLAALKTHRYIFSYSKPYWTGEYGSGQKLAVQA